MEDQSRGKLWTKVLGVVSFIGGNWEWLAAIAVRLATAMTGRFSDFLAQYGPISYVLAFLCGSVLAMLVLSLGSVVRERAAKRAYWHHFRQPAATVNPMSSTFTGLRLAPSDIADPVTRIIRDKTFVGCELLGRRLVFMFSGCHLHAPVGVSECDFMSMPSEDNRTIVPIRNAYKFQDCTFKGCKFYYQTMLFPERNAVEFVANGAIPRDQWMVPPPVINGQERQA